MSIGTILVTLALILAVGTYLARPFRQAADLDRAIEAWVAQVRREQESGGAEEQRSGRAT